MKKIFIIPIFVLSLISMQVNAQCCPTSKAKKEIVSKTDTKDLETVTLSVKGMTCMSCSNHVSNALDKVDGIIEKSVILKEDEAIITFNTKITSVEEIIKVIDKTPYKASLITTKK